MAENDVVARARKALAEYDLAEQRVQSMIDAWETSGWRLDSGMRGDPTPIHEAQTAIAFQLARDFTPDLVRSLLSEVERLRALANYWERQFVRSAAVAKRCLPDGELYAQCEYCHGVGETPDGIRHTTDCFVTEKRQQAKKVYHDAE